MRRAAVYLACFALIGTGCLNRVAQLVGDGGDAGMDGGEVVCTDDSQCESAFYCNFTVTDCPFDAGNIPFAVVNAGACLPAGGSATGACQSGDDCAETQLCFGPPPWGGPPSDEFYCTREAPCDAGMCGEIPGPPPLTCPAGCTSVVVPHTRYYRCVCTGNICSVPDDCPIDGTPCDGGVCIDGGCGYGCWIDDGFVPSDDPLDGGICYGCFPWISTVQQAYLPEGSACLSGSDSRACYYNNLGPITNPCTCVTANGFNCPYVPYDGDAGWTLPCCDNGKCSPTGKCCEVSSTGSCGSDDSCCDNGRCLPGPDGFTHCYWDGGTDGGP